jgi:hypothetical protein
VPTLGSRDRFGYEVSVLRQVAVGSDARGLQHHASAGGGADGANRQSDPGALPGNRLVSVAADDLAVAELESLIAGAASGALSNAEHLPKGPNARLLDYWIGLWLPPAPKTTCKSISRLASLRQAVSRVGSRGQTTEGSAATPSGGP